MGKAAQPETREEGPPMTALASRPPATGTRPRTGPRLAVPMVVTLLAAAGVVLTYRFFVGTSLGQLVDTAAMRGADVAHPRVVAVLDRALNGTTLASLVLACLAAAAIGVLRRRVDVAVGAALLVVGANLTTQLLKGRLVRPNLDDFPAPNSFPSGHTTAAASVAFALILALPHAVRGIVTLVGAAYVAVIAVATVWAEWHRPSDTVAALLVVLAWGGLVAAVLRAGWWRRTLPGRPTRLTTLLLSAVAMITAVASLVGLAAVALSQHVTADPVAGRFAFLAGAAGITAAVAGCFVIWVRLAAGGPSARTDAAPPAVR